MRNRFTCALISGSKHNALLAYSLGSHYKGQYNLQELYESLTVHHIAVIEIMRGTFLELWDTCFVEVKIMTDHN